MAGMGGGTSAVVVKVEGTRDEIIDGQAAGLAHVMRRRSRVARVVLGAAIVPGLLLSVTDIGPLTTPLVVAAAVFLVITSQQLVQQRVERVYRRMPFSGQPWTLTAEWHNLQVVAQTYSSTWSWENIAEITDYRGGLLLVFEGDCNILHLPPSAFPDDAARERAKGLIAGWISAAGT